MAIESAYQKIDDKVRQAASTSDSSAAAKLYSEASRMMAPMVAKPGGLQKLTDYLTTNGDIYPLLNGTMTPTVLGEFDPQTNGYKVPTFKAEMQNLANGTDSRPGFDKANPAQMVDAQFMLNNWPGGAIADRSQDNSSLFEGLDAASADVEALKVFSKDRFNQLAANGTMTQSSMQAALSSDETSPSEKKAIGDLMRNLTVLGGLSGDMNSVTYDGLQELSTNELSGAVAMINQNQSDAANRLKTEPDVSTQPGTNDSSPSAHPSDTPANGTSSPTADAASTPFAGSVASGTTSVTPPAVRGSVFDSSELADNASLAPAAQPTAATGSDSPQPQSPTAMGSDSPQPQSPTATGSDSPQPQPQSPTATGSDSPQPQPPTATGSDSPQPQSPTAPQPLICPRKETADSGNESDNESGIGVRKIGVLKGEGFDRVARRIFRERFGYDPKESQEIELSRYIASMNNNDRQYESGILHIGDRISVPDLSHMSASDLMSELNTAF